MTDTMEENTKTRYSDEELEEFRGIINEMLDKARAEYATLRKVIMNAGGNDILDTAPTFTRRPSCASRTRPTASAA